LERNRAARRLCGPVGGSISLGRTVLPTIDRPDGERTTRRVVALDADSDMSNLESGDPSGWQGRRESTRTSSRCGSRTRATSGDTGGARAHVGTAGIDLVVGIALGGEMPETYWTPQNNLEKSGFRRTEPSYAGFATLRSKSSFSARPMTCTSETSSIRKGEQAGSKLVAFNVRGALLALRRARRPTSSTSFPCARGDRFSSTCFNQAGARCRTLARPR
jgi:hypothetical protein